MTGRGPFGDEHEHFSFEEERGEELNRASSPYQDFDYHNAYSSPFRTPEHAYIPQYSLAQPKMSPAGPQQQYGDYFEPHSPSRVVNSRMPSPERLQSPSRAWSPKRNTPERVYPVQEMRRGQRPESPMDDNDLVDNSSHLYFGICRTNLSNNLVPPKSESQFQNWQVQESNWLKKEKVGWKRYKWSIFLGILGVLALGGGGAAAGIFLSRKNSSTSPSTPDTNPTITAHDPELQGLLNKKNLHQSFYGIDYTPVNSQYQYGCGVNLRNVTLDLAVLSQLTTRIRMYGNDCNITELALDAINILGVNMTLTAGIWVDNNATTLARQIDTFWKAVDKFGVSHIPDVAVGNEVLFRQDMTQSQLIDVISSVKKNLTAKGYSSVKVGTSDLGSNWSAQLAAVVDVVNANVHPFFGGVAIDQSANWTWTYFNQHDVSVTTDLSPAPEVVISEVGWPSGGGTNGGSVAGISQMQEFLDTFVCQSNKQNYKYYYFEAFDEPWKVIQDLIHH